MTDHPREKLLTVDQVAELLGLSTAWVYQHSNGTREPQIPCVKIGRSVRFRESTVLAFIRQMEQVA